MMSISLPESHYPTEQVSPFYTRLLERVRALPGVASASLGGNVPFDGSEWSTDFHLTGTPPYPRRSGT